MEKKGFSNEEIKKRVHGILETASSPVQLVILKKTICGECLFRVITGQLSLKDRERIMLAIESYQSPFEEKALERKNNI